MADPILVILADIENEIRLMMLAAKRASEGASPRDAELFRELADRLYVLEREFDLVRGDFADNLATLNASIAEGDRLVAELRRQFDANRIRQATPQNCEVIGALFDPLADATLVIERPRSNVVPFPRPTPAADDPFHPDPGGAA